MFLGKTNFGKNSTNKNNKSYHGHYVVGFDLGDSYSQISYWKIGTQAPETVSLVAGEENYNIPTTLCKRSGANQWFYGRDAIKNSEEGNGTLLNNLLKLARDGAQVPVEEELFDPVRLLTLFMRRALALINLEVPQDKIAAVMVTTRDMDKRTVQVLDEAVGGLQLQTEQIFFQSYTESFYYYMLYQPEELWLQEVLLFDYSGAALSGFLMQNNRRTTPTVFFVETREYPQMKRVTPPEDEALREEFSEVLDQQFLRIVEDCTRGRMVSSAYLIGEGFSEEWLKESLRLLCRNRRVFQGNNLYSKGACYGAAERLAPGELGKKSVFLGTEKLKSNVGMKVYRQGEESYLALLDAGVNWFEAQKECDIYLKEEAGLFFLVTPLNGHGVREEELELTGLPVRPAGTTRLHLSMRMVSETTVKVTVEDLGFGQIFPASGLSWSGEFEI